MPGSGSLKNSSGCFSCMCLPRRDTKHSIFQTVAQLPDHDFAHLLLLFFDGKRRIDDMKADLLSHSLVFIQDPPLKNPETFLHIAAQTQIHAGFVVLDGVAASENTSDRHIQW